MVGQRAAPASTEHSETSLQPPRKFGRGHRRQARGREFDRQRDPIEPPHGGSYGGRVLRGQLELGLDRGRAFGEQLHRLGLADRHQVGVGVGHWFAGSVNELPVVWESTTFTRRVVV